MKPEDQRWDRVRLWEREYDRWRLQRLSPEEKIGIYEEMLEEVKCLCPEKLGLKKISVLDDAYRDLHLADLLAMRASLIKAYRRKTE
jgi:hypothetical protein